MRNFIKIPRDCLRKKYRGTILRGEILCQFSEIDERLELYCSPLSPRYTYDEIQTEVEYLERKGLLKDAKFGDPDTHLTFVLGKKHSELFFDDIGAAITKRGMERQDYSILNSAYLKVIELLKVMRSF